MQKVAIYGEEFSAHFGDVFPNFPASICIDQSSFIALI
jgi:hypothetical protein